MADIFSHSPADSLGIAISAGESFNLPLSPTEQSPIRLTDLTAKPYKPSLPPAVANVPTEHIRGYVHNKKVNHYLVGSSLGEGSFAKVKEAFHVLVGEKVAMKVIDKRKALQDPYVAKNFKREAKLLQMVRHQNILQLLEVIETDSSFYLITELCSGGELMKYIYKKGKLEEAETRKFMRQIVSAVDHLHRAGIIHRDLKVENMLLDSSMDIKIIATLAKSNKGKKQPEAHVKAKDFGLSNEEYVQGDNGLTHCTTQCGSPAYAAPELLGHKAYGPQVDVWSIGVNMYAMLTGCLPYTVEPFNITALHAKMLENKMNPIPDHLSANCKDLLKRLLRANPDERIKMAEIIAHPWLNEGHTLPFGPAPYPNKLEVTDLNADIVQHMIWILKIKENEEELRQELLSNRSTYSAAVYHLLAARLARYKKHFQPHATRVRRKPSRDQGYYEGDEDDINSVMSMPTKTRTSTRQSSRAGNVNFRQRPGAGKDRPISHPPVVQEIEDEQLPPRHFRRRQTMPEMMLKEEIAKLRLKAGENGRQGTTQRRPSTRQKPTGSTQVQWRDPPKYRYSADAASTLAPVRPPVHLKHSHHSTPSALNMIRDDLSNTLPNQTSGGGVMNAWSSNPSSRNPSRNPSRQGSRQSSGRMPRAISHGTIHARTSSYDTSDGTSSIDQDDLVFHEVKSNSLPRSNHKKAAIMSDSVESINTLPSITETPYVNPTWKRKRSISPEKRNGFARSEITMEIRTEMSVDEVLTEILRTSQGLKIREVVKNGPSSVECTWGGVKIRVVVIKEHYDNCILSFQWMAGGDVISYREKCDRLSKRLKL